MASMLTFQVSPCLWRSLEFRHRQSYPGRVCNSLGDVESSAVVSADSAVNGAYVVKEKEKMGSSVDKGQGYLKSTVGEKKRREQLVLDSDKLEPLWEDGFGTASMKDYLDIAKDLIKSDAGPPRWFCPVECGRPLKDSPLLLFLPGMDGVGLGLIRHHRPLGRVFQVRCLHIPTHDRTTFEGLVNFVEQTVRQEHASSPHKPIYLVGDSFGGCLSLAIAARNPTIDLVLILANPATSVERSQLQPLFPVLEALPDELHSAVPYLLSFVMGEPVKMALANVDMMLPPAQMLRDLSANLTGLLPRLSVLADIIPKDTLLWKLKLLKSAAAHANSHLHCVKAEVLILASGKDNLLPSTDEAKRLTSVLKDCKVRTFKDNGHTLLFEDGINLLTVIKGSEKYRRSRRLDYVSDFLPPSISEYKYAFEQLNGAIFMGLLIAVAGTEDSKVLAEQKKRDDVFLRDRIPSWIAASGYVGLAAISTATIPMVFPPLKWYLVLCSYLLAPTLAFCNSYGTGLTDWNLSSTYGKIGLFIFASLVGNDGGVIAGLAACGVMMSIVSTAADLMQDFKTGYLTVSSAKSMFVSQLVGTAMGCVIAPLTFWLFWTAFNVGDPDGPYKAPYAVIFREMAIIGVEGFSELPKHCLAICCGFFVAAVVMNVLRDVAPSRISMFVPIPMAMAVPFYIGAYFAIDMFVGTVVLFVWERINRQDAEDYAGAVASGLICGDGIWTVPSAILSIFKITPPICMYFGPSARS